MAELVFKSRRRGAVRDAQPPPAVIEAVRGFASGTLIDTPGGPRPVEAIVAGDRVETLDHGPMPVRWVHGETQDFGGLREAARPVLIQAGAFGPDCPARDLVVSAQHRILVGALGQIDGVFGGQCFAPARALTGLPHIRPMMGKAQMRWVHFAFDGHEVVRANGCLAESLCLTQPVIGGLRAFRRKALQRAFAPAPVPNPVPARDCLSLSRTAAGLAEWASQDAVAKVA